MPSSSHSVPAIHHLPDGLFNMDDHERLAITHLSAETLAYVLGGAADELTLRDNRSAWTQHRLMPRVLQGQGMRSGVKTASTLLGRPMPHPLLLAPVAFQQLAHPDGELASICAASAQGVGFVLSSQASMPMDTLAQAVKNDPDRGPLWFQLYWQDGRESTLELAKRAIHAGYEALVLTVDAPVHGVRDRERRAGFVLPAGVRAVNLEVPLQQSRTLKQCLAVAPDWADVAWLREQLQVPLLLKGVLHPEDAQQAQALGLDGVIVSNHGGRVLDTVAATAHALPRIRQAVGLDWPVLVDGGIRRGTDMFKAIALGANAVLIGRPVMMALANAGAAGVAHIIRILLDEFQTTMALCGCSDVRDIHAGYLWMSGGSRG